MQNKKVVIVGGNYSAAVAFYYLQKYNGSSRVPFDLLLIAPRNYFFFQELLPQLFSGSCDINDISQEFRTIGNLQPGVSFLQANLLEIDAKNNTMETTKGKIDYDYLVLSPSFDEYKTPLGLSNVFMMRVPKDVLLTKNHINKVLELASCEKDLDVKRSLLTFTIVGASKEGLEYACLLVDYVSFLLNSYYPEIKKSYITVNLVDKKDTLEVAKNSFYKNYFLYDLEKKNVKLLLNSKVKHYDGNKLLFENGDSAFTSTVIFSGKWNVSSLLNTLNLSSDSNKAIVDIYSRCVTNKNIFILGETNQYELNDNNKRSVFLYALEAKLCAWNIVSTINNNPLKPLKYIGSFQHILNGKLKAIVNYNGITMSGFVGWLFMRGIFLKSFLGFKKQIRAFIKLIICIFKLNDDDMFLPEFEEAQFKKEKVVSKN